MCVRAYVYYIYIYIYIYIKWYIYIYIYIHIKGNVHLCWLITIVSRRKEMFYLTTLNTIYLRLYGIRHGKGPLR